MRLLVASDADSQRVAVAVLEASAASVPSSCNWVGLGSAQLGSSRFRSGLCWDGLGWAGLCCVVSGPVRSRFGLVWFGLVWFGLVWFGLVWYWCKTGTPTVRGQKTNKLYLVRGTIFLQYVANEGKTLRTNNANSLWGKMYMHTSECEFLHGGKNKRPFREGCYHRPPPTHTS